MDESDYEDLVEEFSRLRIGSPVRPNFSRNPYTAPYQVRRNSASVLSTLSFHPTTSWTLNSALQIYLDERYPLSYVYECIRSQAFSSIAICSEELSNLTRQLKTYVLKKFLVFHRYKNRGWIVKCREGPGVHFEIIRTQETGNERIMECFLLAISDKENTEDFAFPSFKAILNLNKLADEQNKGAMFCCVGWPPGVKDDIDSALADEELLKNFKMLEFVSASAKQVSCSVV